MAKRDIGDFSTDADGVRSGQEFVADTRESLKGLWSLQGGSLLNASGSNIITADILVTQGFEALTDGLTVNLEPAETNTGAVTLTVGGIGPKPVKTSSGQSLSAGDLVAETKAQLIFDSDNDHWWLNGSSGTTNVTVNGGLQVKRSEVTRLVASVPETVFETELVLRAFQCTYANSNVVIEGSVSRAVGSGIIDDNGFEIRLYKDDVLIETITDGLVPDTHTSSVFYFTHAPGDVDPHIYKIKAQASIPTQYFQSSTYLVVQENQPN